MNKTASQMNKEIRIIANYRALIISKYFISVLLVAATLYLGVFHYPASPLYILLFLNILPPILNYALKDYAGRSNKNSFLKITSDQPFKLSRLKEKYKYCSLSHLSNSVTYLVALLLICLWQVNYNSFADTAPAISIIPISTLITGLVVRFLGIMIYMFKFPYDLSHNRL